MKHVSFEQIILGFMMPPQLNLDMFPSSFLDHPPIFFMHDFILFMKIYSMILIQLKKLSYVKEKKMMERQKEINKHFITTAMSYSYIFANNCIQ